jgi:hypothetical protein
MLATSLPCRLLCKSVKIRTQGNVTTCTGVELDLSLDTIYDHVATAPSGPGPTHDRSPTITLRHVHSVGVLWTCDQPVAQDSTGQHTTLTTDKHPSPRRDSNPQSQQASGRRHTPQTARPLEWATQYYT